MSTKTDLAKEIINKKSPSYAKKQKFFFGETEVFEFLIETAEESAFFGKPKGKYVIGVCIGTACYVKGSQNVLDKFGEILNIKCGETTEDGLFTLDGLRCIGACGIAPAISINGKVYPKVQLSEVAHIITEYSSKEM